MFDVSQFPTAKGQADEGNFTPSGQDSVLSQREVSVYLDYSLAISVMRNAKTTEIDDVFSRINTYGHRLSDQERRQAGVQDPFAELVRSVSCTIRGDASSDVLGLSQMPSISIDLPKTKHGYHVQADEVFWVQQGILRSTDLRDSMDEQCLADIAGCIVSGQPIERSKGALDAIYESGSARNEQMVAALATYGADRFADELKYCIDNVLKICAAGPASKLREILSPGRSTNPFPATFAVLIVALHESLIGGQKRISSYEQVRKSLTGLTDRISTSRGSTSPDERRKNINTIKGLVSGHLVDETAKKDYRNASSTDIDAALRRSQIEVASYEVKQGLLSLAGGRTPNKSVIDKVIRTICGMANNGPDCRGMIIVGVTDKDADAARITELDQVTPRHVGSRQVVGVSREAKILGEGTEAYFRRWKDGIRNSGLSEPLRGDVLSKMDYNDYFGLGVVVLNVPSQAQLSYVGDCVYWRSGDETVEEKSPRRIADLARRF